MSIKDLFQNSKTNKIIETQTIASASAGVEGVSLVREKSKEKEEFVPPIDFATASNFAKFGSAELYYEYAFKRIQQQYPYDGTLSERQQFENSSSYLDRYIFENRYPRTNGYVNFGIDTSGGSKGSDGYYTGAPNKEYVYILGGPHTASAGMSGKKLTDTFDLSTIYDASNKRENNLKLDLTVGNSIEFWLKKDGFNSTIAEKEIIYDSTNNEGKHFRIFLSASADGTSPLNIEFATSATTSSYSLGSNTFTTSSVADSSWHHYAITMLSQSAGIKTRLFVDSMLNKEQTVSSPWDDIKTNTNGVIGTIGAKVSDSLGDGQLISSSMDEFRFWKSERSGKEIGQNWFVNIGGGTDDSLDNIDLGVYYKFNEGITLTSSTDSVVLDYSGRLSNGRFIGYTPTTRNTGSAIVLSGQTDREYKDPIIYSFHPDVKIKQKELKDLGIIADSENTSMFYHLLPSWIIENDEATGKNIKYLCQIMASYFDTLHAQISYINRIKDDKYFGPLVEKNDFNNKHYKSFSDKDKPHPFSQQLLRHRGFIVPNLFTDATLVEEFLEHDVNEKYDRDIREVKNLIYQNLYNNIIDIYKSKGTEKSFQRYLKNFGIDSDLVKLHLYADRSVYTLRDNYEFKAVKTNGANFNNADNNKASVIQNSGSDGVGYIKNPNDATKYSAYTLEAEVLFPTQPSLNSADYYDKSFSTGSIVGFHRIDPAVDEYTFHGTDKTIKVLIGSTENFEHSQFIITGSDGIYMTSSVIPNLYDDQKWNMALRVKNSKYPLANLTGAIDSVSVDVDFYAVHAENNTIHGTVSMSTSSVTDGQLYLSSSKKVFAGAERANFTGSTLTFSDVIITDVKYWQSYIDNDIINQHAFDSEAFGVTQPLENDSIFAVDNVSVPQKDTLALHWDFENNTQSDSGGSFTVYDASSGSSDMTSRFGWFSEITKNKHYGRGVGFLVNSTKAFDKIYLSTARRRLPSVVYTSDMITIKDQEKEFFFQDDEYMDNFYSFEKSMQAVISDEVVKMFATVVGFNNLIGQPENKYRPNYKDMDFLRQQFFETIENEPDQEKFFEFYKWIDTSVSFGIKQLYPASARFSEGILNVIESHVLERPKYHNKFPMLSPSSPEIGQMMGVKELKYNWGTGHSPQYKPLSNLSNLHCIWQSQRKEDTSTEENKIRRIINTRRPLSSNVLLTQGGALYRREEDVKSFFNTPYDFDGSRKDTIHGGINYQPNKNREVYKGYIQPHGEKNSIGIPKNVHAVGLGLGQGINDTKVCDDATALNKRRISFNTVVGKFSSTTGDHPLDDSYSYEYNAKGNRFAPYNLYSASVEPTGYQKIVSEEYKIGTVITNLHSDTTDLSNEIPLQGPFTQTHVGGRQSRHIALNRHDTNLKTEGGGPTINNVDDQYSRPEEWRILFGEHPSETIQDGVFGMVGPDYGGPYPDPSRKIARWYRDGRTKRHFSIENIRSNSRIMGNFKRNYEVVNSVGRMENNLRFRSIVDTVNFVDPSLKSAMMHTNVNAGLFAQKTGSKGNVLGASGNLTKASVQALRTPEEAGNHEDNNPTKSIIMSKFSAPGSFETSTRVYMDAINAERSPYNALPFRNLMVRNSGSGEHCSAEAGTRNVRALRLPSATGGQEMGITGDLINYPRSGGYSISFWHKMDDTTGVQKYYYEDESQKEKLYWQANVLRWRVCQSGSTPYKEWRWSVTGADASSTWRHYSLSWSGSFSSDPTLYINSVSQSLSTTVTGSGFDTTCNIRKRIDSVRIMDSYNLHTMYELRGALGQFAFWKTALSNGNVDALYNSGNFYDLTKEAPLSLRNNVLDYWQFGEEFTGSANTMIASGTVIVPALGNSNLTVTNEVGITDGWDSFTVHDGLCYARVDSHNNRREGLQTNLRRHLGRFGVDPIHGPKKAGTDSEGIRLLDYDIESNFQKQHRNNHHKMKPFEFDVTEGRFASGSFSVEGMSYTGSFASASFVVTGATVYGIAASGSFDMKGAFYGGSPASASFVITGANEPGSSPSNGSFTVKGAQHLGSIAQGSFVLPTRTSVGTHNSVNFNLPGAYSAGTKANTSFSVGGRTIIGVNSSGSFSITGSSNYDILPIQKSFFNINIDSPSRYGDKFAAWFYSRDNAASMNDSSKQTNGTSTYGVKFGAFHIGQNTAGTSSASSGNDRRYDIWDSDNAGKNFAAYGGAADTTWPSFTVALQTYSGASPAADSLWDNAAIIESQGTGHLISFWFKFDATSGIHTSLADSTNYTLFRFKSAGDNDSFGVWIHKDSSGNFDLRIRKYWYGGGPSSLTGHNYTLYADFFNSSNYGDGDWHHCVISHHYYSFTYDYTPLSSGGNTSRNGRCHNNGANSHAHDLNGNTDINGSHIWVDGTAYTTGRTQGTTDTIVNAYGTGYTSGGGYGGATHHYEGSKPFPAYMFGIKQYGTNLTSVSAINISLDDVYIYDDAYQPAYYYDDGTNRWIDNAGWANGNFKRSTNGTNNDIPSPQELYNGGVWVDYTTLNTTSLVAAYELDETSTSDGDILAAANNSSNNLTIDEYVIQAPRSNSFNAVKTRSDANIQAAFLAELQHAVANTGAGYNIDTVNYLGVNTQPIRVAYTGSTDHTDSSISGRSNSEFCSTDSNRGVFVLGGASAPQYEPRETSFNALGHDGSVTGSITINGSAKTIRHFSLIDKGDIATFSTIYPPLLQGESYSTLGLRWASEGSGTDYGPILYNTSFPFLSDSLNYFSWCSWIRLDNTDSSIKYILALYNDSGNTTPSQSSVRVWSEYSRLYVRLYDQSGNYYAWRTDSGVLSADRYTHVAISYTRSNMDTYNLVIYINGVSTTFSKADAYDSSGTPSGRHQNVNSVFIGDFPNTNNDFEWKGWMTQMAFMRSTLSSSRVKEIFNQGRYKWMWSHTSKTLIENLFAWYKLGDDYMDGGSANTDPPEAHTYTDYASQVDMNNDESVIARTTIYNDVWTDAYAGGNGLYPLTVTADSSIYLSHGIIKEWWGGYEEEKASSNRRGQDTRQSDPKIGGFVKTHLADYYSTLGLVDEVTSSLKAAFPSFDVRYTLSAIDYDDDVIKVTHNATGPITSTSNVSSTDNIFSSIDSNFAGFNRAGLNPGDLITIQSFTFEFYQGSDTSQPGNVGVPISSTDELTWNNLSQSIKDSTTFDTINIDYSYGTNLALFSMTSSRESFLDANNIVIPADGQIISGSCATIVDQTNAGVTGQNESRVYNNDYLKVRDDNSSFYRYLRLYIGSSPGVSSTTTRYVAADTWDNDNDFWAEIATQFGNLTSVNWTITNDGGGNFTLEAPYIGTAYEGKELFGSGSTDGFTSAGHFAGGTAASGIGNGTTFSISGDSDTYQINFSHASATSISINGPATIKAASVSDSTMWGDVETALSKLQGSTSGFTCVHNGGGSFTITSDETGSYSLDNPANPNSLVSSFTETAGGSLESGAPDGGTFTINGVTFEYSASTPSGYTGGNIPIDSDVHAVQFRLNTLSAINGSALNSVLSATNPSGDTILLTANTVGSAYNYAITQNNAGLTSVVDMENGTNVSGSSHLHNITIDGVTFTLVNDGSQHTPGNSNNPFKVQVNTGDDSDFWDALSSSINQHPDVNFGASYSGADGDATATFTVSTELTGTAFNGEPSAFVGASFTIPSTTAGGGNEAGARGNRKLEITRQGLIGGINNTFFIFQRPLVDSDSPPGTLYIETSHSSDAVFWDHLLTKLNTGFDNHSNRHLTASYADNGNGTATFNIVTTSSIESFNDNSGIGMRVQYAAGSGNPPADTILSMNNGNAPTTNKSDNRFFGGINPSGSQHGHTISVAGNTIHLVTSSIGETHEVLITEGRLDTAVWGDMDTLIDGFTNYSAPTTGPGDTAGTRKFTVRHDLTGSGNSPNINSSDSSFSSISNYDGADELGADDPHQLTVAGKVFEISSDQDGESAHPVIIVSSSADTGYPNATSSIAFWNILSGALNEELDDYNISYVPNSPVAGKATFYITASVTGSAFNTSSFSTSGHTFTSLSPSITGGFDGYGGVVHGDGIRFPSADTYGFTIDLNNSIGYGAPVDSPDLSSISSTINYFNYPAKNLEFWGILTQSIKDNTVFDDITLTVECGNRRAEVFMISSATGSIHNGIVSEYVGLGAASNGSFHTQGGVLRGGQAYSSIPISGSNFGKMFDNAFKDTQLPASDYQYSWTHNNVREEYNPTGSKQYTFRYADRTGKILVNGVFENTLNFPTSSIFTLD